METNPNQSESNVFDLKDLNASAISAIARTAKNEPEHKTNITHALERRYASGQLLDYMVGLPSDTPVSIEQQTVGVVYDEKNRRKPPEKVIIKDEDARQKFLIDHKEDLAFVTTEIKGSIPIKDLEITIPTWVEGLNRIITASNEKLYPENPDSITNLEQEIDFVTAEQGWVVSLMGMLARGMSVSQAVVHFDKIGANYDKKVKVPKGGWFNPSNKSGKSYGRLPTISSIFPYTSGFTLDRNTLRKIEIRMQSLYESMNLDELPENTLEELSRPTNITINNGELVFVLPTEHSETILDMANRGFDKRQIVLATEKLERKIKPIGRFITFYPKSSADIDFYPDKEHNVPVRSPVANIDHGTRYSTSQPNPPSGDWS